MLKGFLKNCTEWTDDDKQTLIKNFNSCTYKELSIILNRTESAVRHCANRLGLKKSHAPLNPYSVYNYNVDFFENITTEEQAYWLGFITADGYVIQSKGNCELSIELSIKDIDHLKKFNKSIKGNVQVKTITKPEHFLCGRLIPESEMCCIRLYKSKIVNDIMQYGVVKNKTYIQKNPPIFDDENLNVAFIRGYFDADGCFVINKKTNAGQFDITSVNLKILEYWRIDLYKKYGITSYISNVTHKDGSTVPCYKLNFKGLQNSTKFGELIYRNANIYLDRKYKKYNTYLTQYNVFKRIQNIPDGNYIRSEIASLVSND